MCGFRDLTRRRLKTNRTEDEEEARSQKGGLYRGKENQGKRTNRDMILNDDDDDNVLGRQLFA